jgi:hypothetical protein
VTVNELRSISELKPVMDLKKKSVYKVTTNSEKKFAIKKSSPALY